MLLEIQVADPTWSRHSIINMHSIPPPPPPPLTPYANIEPTDPYSTTPSFESPTSNATQIAPLHDKYFAQIISAVFSTILYISGFACNLVITAAVVSALSFSLIITSLMGISVVNIVVLIITLKYFHAPRLRWWQRLLWSIGATFIAFIMLGIGSVVAEALHMPGAQDTLPASIGDPIAILYSIAIEFIAFR